MRPAEPVKHDTVSPDAITEPCVLCGALAREPIREAPVSGLDAEHVFRLLRCRFCGLVLTDPRPTAAELEAYYGHDYWGTARPDDLTWVRRDQRHRIAFLHRFRRRGRLLDVGCGLGLFLLALDSSRWERYGIEPMPVPYREAASRLGANRIYPGELTAADLPREHFDVITFWDALEHLPNPRAALEEAFRLLRPGGLVLLSLPNFASYQARRFGSDWYALALPRHLYHFTPATLTKLLDGVGFRLRVLEDHFGQEGYHAFKHSLLNRLTRLYGSGAGRFRYYLLKPFLRPWNWATARLGGGAHLQACAERPLTSTA